MPPEKKEPRVSLEDAVRQDRRTALESIRDFLAHELEGSRCGTCEMSRLRTGDTAALVLRLEKTLEQLEAMPANTGEVRKLDELRARKAARTPNAQASTPAAQRRNPRP